MEDWKIALSFDGALLDEKFKIDLRSILDDEQACGDPGAQVVATEEPEQVLRVEVRLDRGSISNPIIFRDEASCAWKHLLVRCPKHTGWHLELLVHPPYGVPVKRWLMNMAGDLLTGE